MSDSTYELIIVGGGPAGAAAAIYAARKRLKTLFVTNEWGGQSTVSTDIQNWVGTPTISGAELAKNLKTHVETHAGDVLTIVSPALATGLEIKSELIEITTNKGTFSGKALLVTSGAQRRKLEVPGAAEFDQKGLTYCASCDGPLFADKDVVVVGGGNAAFETALQLLAYCKTVTLLNRTETFRADEITVASVAAHANMRIIKNAVPTKVTGAQFVTGITYSAKGGSASGGKDEEILLPVEGIFVEIGLLPNTEWVADKLEKNQIGQIKVDPRTQKASHPMIWAAGDCTDGLYHQNNIAAGDAVKALEDIYMALRRA
jgi:alkyl hydroperoxide reductase subunit F